MDPNRVGGPTNALLGENALTTTIGAAGGLANDAASNALAAHGRQVSCAWSCMQAAALLGCSPEWLARTKWLHKE